MANLPPRNLKPPDCFLNTCNWYIYYIRSSERIKNATQQNQYTLVHDAE